VAAVLAIAVLGIVMLSAFNHHLAGRVIEVNLTPETRQKLDAQRIKLAAAEVPAEIDIATQAMIKQAINESFVAGFRLVMLVASGLSLASSACAWLLIGDKLKDQIEKVTLRQSESSSGRMVRFLAHYEAKGIKLKNCPAYIREWMARQSDESNRGKRKE
jgi:hypothetical protein